MKIFVKHYYSYDKTGYMQEIFVEGNYENNKIRITESIQEKVNNKLTDITTFEKIFDDKELKEFIMNTYLYPEQKEAYMYALDYLRRQNK